MWSPIITFGEEARWTEPQLGVRAEDILASTDSVAKICVKSLHLTCLQTLEYFNFKIYFSQVCLLFCGYHIPFVIT